jgi:hypothetical protein
MTGRPDGRSLLGERATVGHTEDNARRAENFFALF